MSTHVLWYTTRATGIVALVLLTATTVLGITTAMRVSTESWPRFAWQDLHRRLSLLSVVFIGLHIATTVADGYAPIGWISAFVPFTSQYRRLWLGLGTVAVDLFLAVGISSLVRSRLSPRLWRALHWLAYVCWPVAVVHALGTGTDPRLHWVLALVVASAAAVVVAAGWRLGAGWPARAFLRGGLAGVGIASVVATSAWAAAGPLEPGWAARAGTPSSLLSRPAMAPSSGPGASSSSAGKAASAPADGLPSAPFSADLAGTITEQRLGEGTREVDIAGTTTGALRAVLAVHLFGYADDGGGITLERSSATFGPPAAPDDYQGTVVGLEGTRLMLSMADATGRTLSVQVDLTVEGDAVQGVVTAP